MTPPIYYSNHIQIRVRPRTTTATTDTSAIVNSTGPMISTSTPSTCDHLCRVSIKGVKNDFYSSSFILHSQEMN